MKRTRLLAAVAALGLAASGLGMASAGASTTRPTIASEIAQQLRSGMTRQNTIIIRLTAHASKASPDAHSLCKTSDGIEVCNRTTGTGPVLGSLLAGFRNINRGGFEAILAIAGPARFQISTYTGDHSVFGGNPPPPVVGNGEGLNVGWLQNTPSATGNYCAGVFWFHGGLVTFVGPEVCIDVVA